MDMMEGPLASVEHEAHTGSTEAQLALGLRYSTGVDIPVDRVTSHMWLNIAAFRGNIEGKRLRAELSREMAHDEVAEAQRRAREWLAENL